MKEVSLYERITFSKKCMVTNRFDFEILFVDLKNTHAFLSRLPLAQTSGHGTARLRDPDAFPVPAATGCHLGVDSALMFVSPEHQIQAVPEEVLRDVVFLAVLGPVLMRHENVEPLVRVLFGDDHPDLAGTVETVQPLVFDGGHPVQCEFGSTCNT